MIDWLYSFIGLFEAIRQTRKRLLSYVIHSSKFASWLWIVVGFAYVPYGSAFYTGERRINTAWVGRVASPNIGDNCTSQYPLDITWGKKVAVKHKRTDPLGVSTSLFWYWNLLTNVTRRLHNDCLISSAVNYEGTSAITPFSSNCLVL